MTLLPLSLQFRVAFFFLESGNLGGGIDNRSRQRSAASFALGIAPVEYPEIRSSDALD